jgi:glycosyltransferase involved in cell wall biosynthesis
LKVLHITNWYPNKFNKNEAKWINDHIKALSTKSDNEVIHFQISPGEEFKKFKYNKKNFRQILIKVPFEKWYFIEFIYFFFLFYLVVIKGYFKKFDIVNFHIAYPMLTYWHWIKKHVKIPIVITEHWSAYHYNFEVKKSLPRIQKIFQQNIPVITVSEALKNDIQNFSKSKFPSYIIPNVVNNEIFFPLHNSEREDFYFMISQWKKPKSPLVVMKAFLESKQPDKRKLIIGGYGPQWDEMVEFVVQNNAQSKIKLIGQLEQEDIAKNMQKCHAFLHPSNYETFSVVCAEAVSCGAYVIAPNVGGIPEVVGKQGLLLRDNNLNSWKKALEDAPSQFSIDIKDRFSPDKIGQEYCKILQRLVDEFK